MQPFTPLERHPATRQFVRAARTQDDLHVRDEGRVHEPALGAIHANRTASKNSPQRRDVPPKVLAELSRDNGWFIFRGRTRSVESPLVRVAVKFHVRHSSNVEHYGTEPWFPRVAYKSIDVLEDWTVFVTARPWVTNARARRDAHFFRQVRSVQPDGINYTRIYDLSRMPELINDITAHLDSIGRPSELYLPRANETVADDAQRV